MPDRHVTDRDAPASPLATPQLRRRIEETIAQMHGYRSLDDVGPDDDGFYGQIADAIIAELGVVVGVAFAQPGFDNAVGVLLDAPLHRRLRAGQPVAVVDLSGDAPQTRIGDAGATDLAADESGNPSQ